VLLIGSEQDVNASINPVKSAAVITLFIFFIFASGDPYIYKYIAKITLQQKS
jgi:hypothetical protein